MLHVIATIQLHPGTRQSFLDEFRKLVPLVRAEAGCIEYGPGLDTPTGFAAQPPLRDDAVTVVEKWADLPALQAHMAAPHMADYRELVKVFVQGVTLHVLEPA